MNHFDGTAPSDKRLRPPMKRATMILPWSAMPVAMQPLRCEYASCSSGEKVGTLRCESNY